MSNQWKTAFQMGEIVPMGLWPCLPGETWRGGSDFFAQLQPLNAPPFTKLEIVIDTHFVADRNVWDDSEEFHSGGAYGSTPPVYPTINLNTAVAISEGSLADLLGIRPTATTGDGKRTVSALPFRVYQAIINKRHFNTELHVQRAISTASGNDTTTYTQHSVCNWTDDYFTKMSPRQMKTSALLVEVERLTNAPGWKAYNTGTNTAHPNNETISTLGGVGNVSGTGTTTALSLDPQGGLVLNTSEIRDSMQLLKYFENAARRRTDKYSDYIADVFGVSKEDMRLDEPLLLSSTRDTIRFNDVTQTAPDSGDEGVGSYKARGIGAAKAKGWKNMTGEHGWIMVTAYIRPQRSAYQDGIPRYWWKTTKEQHFQPELAHMAQQAVQNREVYADGAAPTGTMGYIDMYEDYRSAPDVTTSSMRTTFDYFHTDRQFTADQALNQSFLECVPDSRIFQDTSSDQFLAIAYNKVKALRPVPPSGKPA